MEVFVPNSTESSVLSSRPVCRALPPDIASLFSQYRNSVETVIVDSDELEPNFADLNPNLILLFNGLRGEQEVITSRERIVRSKQLGVIRLGGKTFTGLLKEQKLALRLLSKPVGDQHASILMCDGTVFSCKNGEFVLGLFLSGGILCWNRFYINGKADRKWCSLLLSAV